MFEYAVLPLAGSVCRKVSVGGRTLRLARPDPDAGFNRLHALSARLYLEPAPAVMTVIAEVPHE